MISTYDTAKLNEKINNIMPNDSGKKKIPVIQENAIIYLAWRLNIAYFKASFIDIRIAFRFISGNARL